jgi:hypothetical protein
MFDNGLFAGFAGHRGVAICFSSGMATVADDAGLTAVHLFAMSVEPDLPEKSMDPNPDRIRLAIVHREDRDTEEFEPFPDGRKIPLVARQSVKRFHHHDIEAVLSRICQQVLKTITPDHRRGCARPVRIGPGDVQPFPRGVGGAKRNLIVDGLVSLEVCREPRIDGSPLSLSRHA